MAGSRLSGPYGSIRAPCQPSAGVHSTVNMWSVKWTPKPGLARISARRASSTGCSVRVVLMSMDIKVVALSGVQKQWADPWSDH